MLLGRGFPKIVVKNLLENNNFMATINYYIKRTARIDDDRAEIQLRFSGNRSFVKRALTGIFVTVENWDAEKGMPKDKRSSKFSSECDDIRERLELLRRHLIVCWEDAQERGGLADDSLTRWIEDVVWTKEDEVYYIRGEKRVLTKWSIQSKAFLKKTEAEDKIKEEKIENQFFLDNISLYAEEQLANGKICKRRYDHYTSLYGQWDRMEKVQGKSYKTSALTTETLYDFRRFIMTEHELWEMRENKYQPKRQFAWIYNDYKVALSRGVKQRSMNYVSDEMGYLSAMWNWLRKVKACELPDIFGSFQWDSVVYGTPFFIGSEDRNTLFNADLSARPALAVQRDIFVFQSLIGCRVGDLMRLKKSNIINGEFLQYVAGKTKNDNGRVLNVPLHKDAKTILARYSDLSGDKLLPFISSQKYNDAIKEIFKAVPEVDRLVTVLNPLTRQEEQRYLHEVASSHMARRNFCGNLYEAGFADSDIGSMSGHSEKSREIARYRKVSVDRQVKMIDSL